MRAVDRALSTLLGLALPLAGLLTLVNLVLRGLGRPWWPRQLPAWAGDFAAATWQTRWVQITCACLLVAGVLLLIGQLSRWTPAELPVAAEHGAWFIKRRSAEQRLSAAAGIAGTRAVKTSVRLRKGLWQAKVTADARRDLEGEVARSVKEAMVAMGAPEGSSARVRLASLRRAA